MREYSHNDDGLCFPFQFISLHSTLSIHWVVVTNLGEKETALFYTQI
jgi:hypothetical protein